MPTQESFPHALFIASRRVDSPHSISAKDWWLLIDKKLLFKSHRIQKMVPNIKLGMMLWLLKSSYLLCILKPKAALIGPSVSNGGMDVFIILMLVITPHYTCISIITLDTSNICSYTC